MKAERVARKGRAGIQETSDVKNERNCMCVRRNGEGDGDERNHLEKVKKLRFLMVPLGKLTKRRDRDS